MYNKMDKEEAYPAGTKVVGMIELTKVVREHVPLIEDQDGNTFGMILDNVLRDAALNGEEIQTFTLNMEKDDWQRFAIAMQDEHMGIPPRHRRK
jgi:hypothetical protein